MKKSCVIRAFSLIEVLIFASILSLFFVAAAAIMTVSLRNMKFNEHKILATRYGEELLEWLRGEKEDDWKVFFNKALPNTKNYCFNTSPIPDVWPAEGLCDTNNYSLVTFLKRETLLSVSATDEKQLTANITVQWKELGNTHSVTLKSVFAVTE